MEGVYKKTGSGLARLFSLALAVSIQTSEGLAQINCSAATARHFTDKKQSKEISSIRVEGNRDLVFSPQDITEFLRNWESNRGANQDANLVVPLEKVSTKTVPVVEIVDLLVKTAKASSLTLSEKTDFIASFYNKTVSMRIENRSKIEKKYIKFTFAKAILDLESFQGEDFRKTEDLALVTKKMLYVHIADFLDFSRSYIKNEPPYSDVPSQGRGILDYKDIRDIESHNLFPVEFKGHDVLHVHYSLGHPLALAMLWTSARSKNHRRYVLMSGLFEGVDTFQYFWESRLTSHFRSLGLELEEAMIQVGLMTSDELDLMIEKVDARSVVHDFKDWMPKAQGEFTGRGRHGQGLDEEVVRAVVNGESYLADKNLNWVTNYSRLRLNSNGSTESDHSIH